MLLVLVIIIMMAIDVKSVGYNYYGNSIAKSNNHFNYLQFECLSPLR